MREYPLSSIFLGDRAKPEERGGRPSAAAPEGIRGGILRPTGAGKTTGRGSGNQASSADGRHSGDHSCDDPDPGISIILKNNNGGENR